MTPDALILPPGSKRGARMVDRVASICDIAEPLLGVDRSADQHAWIRQQPHGRLFVTRDPLDSINFPNDHPRSGEPRYEWVDGPDGIRRGYLKPEAIVGVE
jgi:hypothetical protein